MFGGFKEWLRKISCRISCLFYTKPKYEPEKWNDEGEIAQDCTCNLETETKVQCMNNCYNYACDIQNNTFAQPGAASGHPAYNDSIRSLVRGIISDGLWETDRKSECPGCCHKVALVVWPNYNGGWNDYHFYRKDINGKWSHKPGKYPVTDRDQSGNVIDNPETADNGIIHGS